MNITKAQINSLILGSSFLSTGGGGDPKEAKQIYLKLLKKKSNLKMLNLNSFNNQGVFITAFGVGPVTTSSDPSRAVKRAFSVLSKFLDKKIQGIIPVEIGPKSLATAFYLASILKLPVVDADIVGGRSSPEIFLETITLFNIPRTPAVVANNQGDTAVLLKSSSATQEEKFFRDFAISSGERAYVVGYPLTKKQAKSALVSGTITLALNMGELLQKDKLPDLLSYYCGKLLFEGILIKLLTENTPGFTTQTAVLKQKNKLTRIFIRNENLICWINDKIVVTCPDLIIMLDRNNKPIFNRDLRKGQFIKVIALPVTPLWRSKKGIKLFSPKVFGFNFDSKLL